MRIVPNGFEELFDNIYFDEDEKQAAIRSDIFAKYVGVSHATLIAQVLKSMYISGCYWAQNLRPIAKYTPIHTGIEESVYSMGIVHITLTKLTLSPEGLENKQAIIAGLCKKTAMYLETSDPKFSKLLNESLESR